MTSLRSAYSSIQRSYACTAAQQNIYVNIFLVFCFVFARRGNILFVRFVVLPGEIPGIGSFLFFVRDIYLAVSGRTLDFGAGPMVRICPRSVLLFANPSPRRATTLFLQL